MEQLRNRWQVTSASGVCRLLQRLGVSYKRARAYVHSPDQDYAAKRSLIELARLRAQYAPEQYRLLYLDEMSYFRQPTLARDYESVGHRQPLAYQSYRSNTRQRVLGALDAHTGQVHFQQARRITLAALNRFYRDLCAAYPAAEVLYVVLDNWPVHFHPQVLAHLVPQSWPFAWVVPGNWFAASARAVPPQERLPIQLLPLPTYASWLNPIEKLWRWLRQDLLHLHRQRDDWQALKQRVVGFLDGFTNGSARLLRYVGLLPH